MWMGKRKEGFWREKKFPSASVFYCWIRALGIIERWNCFEVFGNGHDLPNNFFYSGGSGMVVEHVGRQEPIIYLILQHALSSTLWYRLEV